MSNNLTGKPTFKSLPSPNAATCTRESVKCHMVIKNIQEPSRTLPRELKAFFENSYDLDETLFSGIIGLLAALTSPTSLTPNTDNAAFYTCPDRLRLPLVFYVAHTSAVFVNKMILAGLISVGCEPLFPHVIQTHATIATTTQKRVNPEFEILFETGVDEMSWDDTVCFIPSCVNHHAGLMPLQENYRMGGAFKWPSMEEVFAYRK